MNSLRLNGDVCGCGAGRRCGEEEAARGKGEGEGSVKGGERERKLLREGIRREGSVERRRVEG